MIPATASTNMISEFGIFLLQMRIRVRLYYEFVYIMSSFVAAVRLK